MSSLMYNVILTIKIQKLIKSLFQVNLDYFIISDQLKKANSIDNDGMIEFLRKSREDAFSYIESVQSALEVFKQELGPIVDYHDKFGDVIYNPMGKQLDEVVLSYKKLMLLLPDRVDEE